MRVNMPLTTKRQRSKETNCGVKEHGHDHESLQSMVHTPCYHSYDVICM